MKISRDDAYELRCGGEAPGFEYVETVTGDKHRWFTVMHIVLRDTAGELWGFDFEEANTENQDNGELDEEIDLYPVEAVQVTTYRRKK